MSIYATQWNLQFPRSDGPFPGGNHQFMVIPGHGAQGRRLVLPSNRDYSVDLLRQVEGRSAVRWS